MKKIIALAFFAIFITSTSSFAEMDVVRDSNGNVIKNSFGNCVRTKWEATSTLCGEDTNVSNNIEQTKTVTIKSKRDGNVVESHRRYMVFFDFGSSQLTNNAKSILSKVVKSTKNTLSSYLELAGHTDRSGSEDYNIKLSKKRAVAVKNHLKEMGNKFPVSIKWEGESNPLVQTEDGTKEPQNRRVEIKVMTKVKE